MQPLISRLRTKTAAAFVALLLSAAESAANYIPLFAGQTVAPTLGNTEPVSFAGPWQNISAFGFSIVSAAYGNADGNIDFFYQVSRGSHSDLTGPLSFSLQNFGGAWNRPMQNVEVGYRTDGGSFPRHPTFPQFPGFVDGNVVPLSAQRSLDGDMITFDFANFLSPGTTSTVFVISTHQQAFSNGPIFTNENGVPRIETLAVTMPNFPTPDSGSSLALVVASLICIGIARRRRRSTDV
jgi:hypothetical protein